MFGGIKVIDDAEMELLGLDQSYLYQNDMMRYNLINNQWDLVESYGISLIKREVFFIFLLKFFRLGFGTVITTIKSLQLKTNSEKIKRQQKPRKKNKEENFQLQEVPSQ